MHESPPPQYVIPLDKAPVAPLLRTSSEYSDGAEGVAVDEKVCVLESDAIVAGVLEGDEPTESDPVGVIVPLIVAVCVAEIVGV